TGGSAPLPRSSPAATARVRRAYAARLRAYAALSGTAGQMHAAERLRIARWAATLPRGRGLDAACGPRHWAAFLHERGADVEGVDLVPAFIEHACRACPHVPYRAASLEKRGHPDAGLVGGLAWSSLIHMEPAELGRVLDEFRRVVA